jgi:hypothetical protein
MFKEAYIQGDYCENIYDHSLKNKIIRFLDEVMYDMFDGFYGDYLRLYKEPICKYKIFDYIKLIIFFFSGVYAYFFIVYRLYLPLGMDVSVTYITIIVIIISIINTVNYYHIVNYNPKL